MSFVVKGFSLPRIPAHLGRDCFPRRSRPTISPYAIRMATSDKLPQSMIAKSPADVRRPGGLDYRAYEDVKIGIHRYLLNKLDLEAIASVPPERTQAQVFAVIQGVVAQIKTPLTAAERDRGSRNSRRSLSASDLSSPCSRIRPSATSW